VAQLDIVIHILNIIIQSNKILDVSVAKSETTIRERGGMQIREDQTQILGTEGGPGTPDIEIRPLQSNEDCGAFRTLNEEWITRYFALEKKDREVLEDPDGQILKKGGHIFMVCMGDDVVGCVALIPLGAGVYELSKMAVSPQYRGFGIGRRLLQYTIEQAKVIGASSLFLGSNAKLKNAVHLYEAVGFRHVPPEDIPPTEYARADVFMEMQL
jgi:putative acetyltransferase